MPLSADDRRPAAVFLDRDGCLIEEKDYLSDPAQVELLPGVPAALRALQAAGYRLIVVTNQSGVARGYFTEDDVRAVHARLEELLVAAGVRLDGVYYSPYHPAGTVAPYDRESPCRKPGPGMLLQAAVDFGLCLERSIMIGDKLSDLDAAAAAGAEALLVLTGYGEESLRRRPAAPHVATLTDAATRILGRSPRV